MMRRGAREFVSTIENLNQALSAARMLSRQDPRDVVVIENRDVGDTIVRAVFRRGQSIDGQALAIELADVTSPVPNAERSP
jgi:hypothetical protein